MFVRVCGVACVCVRVRACDREREREDFAYDAYPTTIKEIGTHRTCFQNSTLTGLYT